LTNAPDRVDRIDVPGATTSGFIRFSLVGPRLLKAAMPSALFVLESLKMGLFGKKFARRKP
jgi:hypothetical protein